MKATEPRTMTSSNPHPFATVDLFGMAFLDAPDEKAVSDHLLRAPRPSWSERSYPLLVTPNVDIVVQLEKAKKRGLRDRLMSSAFVLPDGAPIVWTSRLTGTPLQARIAGSTLFEHWWPAVAADRRRVVVMCSTEAVKAGLTAEHPGASVVVAPMIDTSDEQVGQAAEILLTEALRVDAEFCVVCIGHPKDPMVALAASDRWPADRPPPLFLCLGASAEMYLGIKRRAPRWAQRCGLEWLHRFAQEPRRMFHRYFVRDLGFFPMALREIANRRRS